MEGANEVDSSNVYFNEKDIQTLKQRQEQDTFRELIELKSSLQPAQNMIDIKKLT